MGLNETTTEPGTERAILVGTEAVSDGLPPGGPLAELASLAETALLTVVDAIGQKVDRPTPRYYIGGGKVETIKERAAAGSIDLAVFDRNLTPAQTRNLEKALDLKVIDRTELILDIFASHAQTPQAMLQVELAQLEYALPRLKRMWTHLSRIEGGIGLRGPGEKQLELDRRLIRKRISEMKAQLDQIGLRKERQIEARGDSFQVSLVGYTNAGKSTLMNRLTDAGVGVENKLFSTLDTRTRSWRMAGGAKVLLSDTVGFIRHLPHSLVASFHATLEETATADLLIHVVDASHPEAEEQIAAVEGVLRQIGGGDKPVAMVFNKVDQLTDPLVVNYLRQRYPNAIALSARTGIGVEVLEAAAADRLRAARRTVSVTCDVADGRLLAFIAEKAELLDRAYEGETVRMTLSLLPKHLAQIAASPSAVVDEVR